MEIAPEFSCAKDHELTHLENLAADTGGYFDEASISMKYEKNYSFAFSRLALMVPKT